MKSIDLQTFGGYDVGCVINGCRLVKIVHVTGGPYYKLFHIECKCGVKFTRRASSIINSGCSFMCKNCSHPRTQIIASRSVETACNRIIYKRYTRQARDRGFHFDLDFDIFQDLVARNCSYCDLPPSNIHQLSYKSQVSTYFYSGVDRVDSMLGYSKENCVAACANCNRAKSDSSVNDFLTWVRKVYETKIAQQ